MPPFDAFLYVFGFACTFWWLVSLHHVLCRVKNTHPDVYDSMGRPHLLTNNTPRHTRPVLAFILDRRYRLLSDPILDRLGDRARVAFLTAAVSIGAMFLVFLSAMLGAPPQR